jgi:uncharacterized protein
MHCGIQEAGSVPTRPIAEDLITWRDGDPSLVGSRCEACGTYAFPVLAGCPKCGATSMRQCELERAGVLWSWTSQGFVPKEPFAGTFMADPFEPWFVGLIELPGQLRLESILTGCPQETLRFGMPMRLVTLPFRTDSDGTEVVTFAFTPAEPGAAGPGNEAQSEETARA